MTSPTSLLLTLVVLCGEVRGHGRLLEPPSRASMWRVGFKTPQNYDDNQLFCGGFQNQQSHGGKCGVCGDPYQGPRLHEAGGKYATGTIARTYAQGQKISITVQITSNHKGWFEFRLCPVNNKHVKATQQCLDQNVLQLADGSGTRYMIGSENKRYHIDVILPSHLTCTQCVLQWRYHTANSWGVDRNGRGCLGCGAQEEFYGCSDVAITASENGEDDVFLESKKTTTTTTVEVTTTEAMSTEPAPPKQTGTPTESGTCSASTSIHDTMDNRWCAHHCGSNTCKQVLMCV